MFCNMKDAFAFLFDSVCRKNENRAFEPMLKDAIAFYEAYYTPFFFVCQALFQKKSKNFSFSLDKRGFAAYNTFQ